MTDAQDLLNAHPPSLFASLSVDGVFGGKTQGRVKEFQRNNGLAVDGIVGPKTWGKLAKAPGQKPPTPTVKPPSINGSRVVQEARRQVGIVDYQRRVGPANEPYGWRHLV